MKAKTITITRSLVVSIVVIVIILLLPLFVRQSRSELEKTIMTCEASYSENYRLTSVMTDDSGKKIVIHFRYVHGDISEQLESMRKTFDSVNQVLLLQEDSRYAGYTVNYSFENVSQKFLLMNVNQSMSGVQLHSDMQISLSEIAAAFPDASELYLYPAYYSSIDEIKSFKSLRKIYFSEGITPEDKAVVQAAYPNCMIAD